MLTPVQPYLNTGKEIHTLIVFIHEELKVQMKEYGEPSIKEKTLKL